MVNSEYAALKSALLWHIDAGADSAFSDQPVSMLSLKEAVPEPVSQSVKPTSAPLPFPEPAAPAFIGASEARAEAVKLAAAARTLEDLRAAIAGFDGIGLKDTASNLVFAGGQAGAPIMFIGDAPAGDDDRDGKPFAGANGQLLDAILKAGGMTRNAPGADGKNSGGHTIYISNVLNWRPPGNRSPTPAEIEVSLPFIERHIQLAKPKLLILLGEVPARALLGRSENISKLRGRWLDYLPQTKELASVFEDGAIPIPVISTYHPAYLAENPAQKRPVWSDILLIMEKIKELGFISDINSLNKN
ncbi:MAG: uracil-DNA glycosylase, 4 family protein [Micavibrio sp.]|nr:uracil-DNA glycosylase, 4 family protein [Micavibrio sp.]